NFFHQQLGKPFGLAMEFVLDRRGSGGGGSGSSDGRGHRRCGRGSRGLSLVRGRCAAFAQRVHFQPKGGHAGGNPQGGNGEHACGNGPRVGVDQRGDLVFHHKRHGQTTVLRRWSHNRQKPAVKSRGRAGGGNASLDGSRNQLGRPIEVHGLDNI